MFAKGRTELQFIIDFRAEVLKHTIREVIFLIEGLYEKAYNELVQIAKDSADGDKEVEDNILQSLETSYGYDNKDYIIELIHKAIIVMVDSYCESILKSINGKTIKTRSDGKTEIEKLLTMLLLTHNCSAEELINKHWPNFKEFHKIRNSIVHEDKVLNTSVVNLDTEYIVQNIENARMLLRALDAIVSK